MTRALLKQGIKLLAGVVVLALLAFAFWPRPLPVDMAQVTRGDVVIGLDGEGKTRIRDIYVVSAPIDGRVTRVEIDPGDQVRSGVTVIANMSPADPDFLDLVHAWPVVHRARYRRSLAAKNAIDISMFSTVMTCASPVSGSRANSLPTTPNSSPEEP